MNLSNTTPLYATGHPAISSLVEAVGCLPVGLQLVRTRFDDEVVHQTAVAGEETVEVNV